jgi:hypothetical protein
VTATVSTTAEVMRDLISSAPPPRQIAVDSGRDTRIRLGGGLFDVVVTGGGPQGRAVATVMDEIQNGCGPVIEDPDSGWLYWLVPPGSSSTWEPHGHAVCIGAPHTITLPALPHTEPPGPYWLRPSASDRLVPVRPLRDALNQFRPEPTPHTGLEAHLRFTTP